MSGAFEVKWAREAIRFFVIVGASARVPAILREKCYKNTFVLNPL